MKKTIPYLFVTLIIYLIFSFVPMQFNPVLWSKDYRAFFVFIWVMSMIIVPMIIVMTDSMKDQFKLVYLFIKKFI